MPLCDDLCRLDTSTLKPKLMMTKQMRNPLTAVSSNATFNRPKTIERMFFSKNDSSHVEPCLSSLICTIF